MSVWVIKTRPAAELSAARQIEALRARRAAGSAPTAAQLERQLWLARAMPILLDVWADTRSGIPLARARIVDVHIAHRPQPVDLGPVAHGPHRREHAQPPNARPRNAPPNTAPAGQALAGHAQRAPSDLPEDPSRLCAMAIHAVGSHVVEVRFDSRARLDQGARAAHTLHIAFRTAKDGPAGENVPGPTLVRFRAGPPPAAR